MADEPTGSAAVTEPKSSAAKRMHRHRERRRRGVQCVTVQVFKSEVDELVRRELLRPEMRNNRAALADALHLHLDDTLGADQQKSNPI